MNNQKDVEKAMRAMYKATLWLADRKEFVVRVKEGESWLREHELLVDGEYTGYIIKYYIGDMRKWLIQRPHPCDEWCLQEHEKRLIEMR